MFLVGSFSDTGTCPILISADVLNLGLLEDMRQRNMPDVRNASGTKLVGSGIFILDLRMGEWRTHVKFGFVDKLALSYC